MIVKTALVAGAAAALASLLAGPASASDAFRRPPPGGFVIPCSLDGVNPAHHPSIFGNPAVARSYGFVVGPDRAWHVIPNCSPYSFYSPYSPYAPY